jgi:hypothetical protein
LNHEEALHQFKETLLKNERVIVYLDADEFPNSMFVTNLHIMDEVKKLLGDKYKVLYVWDHLDKNYKIGCLIHGVVINMSPYIVLYKNGIEAARIDNTFLDERGMILSEKLEIWIREKLE